MAGLNRAYKRRGNMVVNTGAPVLCLDAGSKLSYPGSGTTWTDLSGNGYNGTLTNGPTYNSANYGSIVFDGINDKVLTTLSVGGYANLSVCSWFKTSSTYKEIISSYGTGSTFELFIQPNSKISFYIYGTTLGYRTSNTSVATNNWVYGCGVFNGSAQTIDTYVNGVVDNGALTGAVPASAVASSLPVVVGAAFSSTLYNLAGNIAQVTIYNRALSAAEVNTNFQLTRRRYGI